MNTDKPTTTASASQNRAMAKDAALTGLKTLDPNDMPTEAQRKKWRNEYRKAQDGALKLIPAAKLASAPELKRIPFGGLGNQNTNRPVREQRTIPAERTYNDADREAIARGNATAKRINAQAQADKRTIPAEKPTAVTAEGLREDRLIAIANRYKAHADKLAEALRDMALVTVWGKSSPVLAKAKQALAAYEESR